MGKKLKETINNNSHINITGIVFERSPFPSDFYPFHWLKNNETKGQDNDYIKVKNVDFDFMLETLKNMLPKINIIVNQ